MRTGNHRSKLPTTAPPFTPKALEDCSVVRLKANNVPTARVHILSGSAAFPQSLAIFWGGKGLSYTRTGRPLCVAVIHAKLYEQLSSYGCSQSQRYSLKAQLNFRFGFILGWIQVFLKRKNSTNLNKHGGNCRCYTTNLEK